MSWKEVVCVHISLIENVEEDRRRYAGIVLRVRFLFLTSAFVSDVLQPLNSRNFLLQFAKLCNHNKHLLLLSCHRMQTVPGRCSFWYRLWKSRPRANSNCRPPLPKLRIVTVFCSFSVLTNAQFASE